MAYSLYYFLFTFPARNYTILPECINSLPTCSIYLVKTYTCPNILLLPNIRYCLISLKSPKLNVKFFFFRLDRISRIRILFCKLVLPASHLNTAHARSLLRRLPLSIGFVFLHPVPNSADCGRIYFVNSVVSSSLYDWRFYFHNTLFYERRRQYKYVNYYYIKLREYKI